MESCSVAMKLIIAGQEHYRDKNCLFSFSPEFDKEVNKLKSVICPASSTFSTALATDATTWRFFLPFNRFVLSWSVKTSHFIFLSNNDPVLPKLYAVRSLPVSNTQPSLKLDLPSGLFITSSQWWCFLSGKAILAKRSLFQHSCSFSVLQFWGVVSCTRWRSLRFSASERWRAGRNVTTARWWSSATFWLGTSTWTNCIQVVPW